MGEKPMGAGDEEEVDPMAGAAGINTTRSNIKHAGSVTTEGGTAGTAGTAGGGAEPGIAIKEQGIK